MLSNEEN